MMENLEKQNNDIRQKQEEFEILMNEYNGKLQELSHKEMEMNQQKEILNDLEKKNEEKE